MRILRTFLLTLTAMLSATVFADGIEYIVVEKTDASTTQTALDDFKQIKFSSGQMLMLDNNGQAVSSYQLKELRRMYFGPLPEETGIDQTEWIPTGDVEVYSTSGILLQRGSMSLESLPHGIYIIRQGKNVKKVRL